MARQVFSEHIDGRTYWGIYDSDTGEVVEWYDTEREAEAHA